MTAALVLQLEQFPAVTAAAAAAMRLSAVHSLSASALASSCMPVKRQAQALQLCI